MCSFSGWILKQSYGKIKGYKPEGNLDSFEKKRLSQAHAYMPSISYHILSVRQK
jgi:hypothetical protein